IPEAMDVDGKVFGGDRLLGALDRARGEPIDGAVASLLGELREWTGSAGLRDDVSLVAVEDLGPLSFVIGHWLGYRPPRPLWPLLMIAISPDRPRHSRQRTKDQ